jgi:hypothetical protein
MSRYYFDLREAGELAVDDEGLELPILEAVRIEAARSLVDIARHAVWTKNRNPDGTPDGNRGPGHNRPAATSSVYFRA